VTKNIGAAFKGVEEALSARPFCLLYLEMITTRMTTLGVVVSPVSLVKLTKIITVDMIYFCLIT
jgi:hypothetical protein